MLTPTPVAQYHIENATSSKVTDDFVPIDQRPCGLWEGRVGLVPAIAIPVEKKAYFEFPQTHLEELVRALSHVDKLLLIGWRATEDHFLTLLARCLKSPLIAQVVAGSLAEATSIASGLDRGALSRLTIHWEPAPGGFTDFVINRRVDAMLSHTASV